MCKLRACKRQFMVISHTLQQKRRNETPDWWPFSTRGMSTFLLLKIAMKKCLFGPELNVFLVHWPLRDNVWNQVIGNCQRRNMIKNNHYYLIFCNSNSMVRLFLLHAVYRLKCWELKQQQRRRQRERLKSNWSRVCLHGGERGVRWNNPLSWGYPPAYIIFHFSNESGRTLTATTCQFFFFFFFGGGGMTGLTRVIFYPT